MTNINLKQVIKIFFKIIWSILALVGLAVTSIFLYYLFDDKAHCLDIGKIYDPVQKICRDDCLTWDDKLGCVPITEENIEKKEKGEL
jgi:hypothetical protein